MDIINTALYRLTPAQHRYNFISALHKIVGHERMRLLWLPKGTDTTTTTSADRYARTITYDATITARLSALGLGYAVSFNGTSQYGSTPDVDVLSFGDGLNDQAFSILALINITDTAGGRYILAKNATTTGATQQEYMLYVGSTDLAVFLLYDDSAGTAYVGRQKATAVTQSTWILLSATYDGTRNPTGCALYENTTRIDGTSLAAGTYIAMENKTCPVYLGAVVGTAGTAGGFFAGSMAMIALIQGQVQPDDLWGITNLCNWYFNLSLGV